MEIKEFAGLEAKKYLTELALLRINIFREYPYLYDGNIESELLSLQRYLRSDNFSLFVVFDNGKPVGMNTCLPLAAENLLIRQPFIDQNIDTNKYFYVAESLLLEPYRNKGIGKKLLHLCENKAIKLQGIEFTCFCTVLREKNHPAKPSDYIELDGFCEKLGYHRQENLRAKLSWREINHEYETPKSMVFWTKPIGTKGQY